VKRITKEDFMKIVTILILAAVMSGCSGLKEQQDLKKSPCAGSPCAGQLPHIPNAAAKV
jgi:hypothetical protein